MSEPTIEPGRVPDGYRDTRKQELLTWPEVRLRLEQAKHFWFSTADADRAPHARPIWGAWVDDTLYPDEAFGRVQSSYLDRYREYQPDSADGLFMVKPRQVLAWTRFPVDVTRFNFS